MYDVIIVGAGPAGLFSALKFSQENKNLKVLLIDKGNLVENRQKTEVMNGFGGAGTFSDGKLHFLRPGRFDVKLEIPLPKLETREKIFEVYIKKMNVDKKIKIKELAKKTDGASGADIEAICREAGMFAIRENIVSKEKLIITSKHFEKAIERIMRISESKRKEDSLAR